MIGGIDLRCCGGVRTGSRLLLALWIKQEGNSNLSQSVVQWCVDCHWLATSNNTKSERCPFITRRQTDKRVTCSDGLTATSDEMMESTVIPKWLILPIHLSPNVVILLERKKAKKAGEIDSAWLFLRLPMIKNTRRKSQRTKSAMALHYHCEKRQAESLNSASFYSKRREGKW